MALVEIEFTHRVMVDSSFIIWLEEQNENLRREFKTGLMYVRTSSKYHRGEHNIILDFELKNTINLNQIKSSEISKSFKEKDSPQFLMNYETDISKNIIYAIKTLNSEKPYETFIFTTEENYKGYVENPHLKGIKNVNIKTNSDAVNIVKRFYGEFKNKRQTLR